MHIAKHSFQMATEERPVRIDSLQEFVEAGACGTAAVITPIGGIFYNNVLHTFYADGKEAGPVTKKLYDTLTGIQRGEQEGPEGWVVAVK
jgi:branched-chain amino acid aminotransferase